MNTTESQIQLSPSELYHPGVSPAIQDLSRKSGMPETEVASIYAQTERDEKNDAAENPDKIVMDVYGNCRFGDKVWSETRKKVLTPEETESDSEKELENTLADMSTMFSPEEEQKSPGGAGEIEDAFAASLSPSIDNNSLGFSDEDMALTNSVADAAAADYDLPDDSEPFSTDTFTDIDPNVTPDNVNSAPDGSSVPTGGEKTPLEETKEEEAVPA